jgi:hypothetical protein
MVRPSGYREIGCQVDLDSFPPRIRGLDEVPDFKLWLERALKSDVPRSQRAIERCLQKATAEYRRRVLDADAHLPRPYSDMLATARGAVAAGDYGLAVETTEKILDAFLESPEAAALRRRALFRSGRHPVQGVLDEARQAGKFTAAMRERFFRAFLNLGAEERDSFGACLLDLYDKSETWAHRMLALDAISEAILGLGPALQDALDDTLLKALRDSDGRVRHRAVLAVRRRRGPDIPIDFFFKVFARAETEPDLRTRETLCRALLELVAPITDYAMRGSGLSSEYRRAVRYALQVTGHDPAYYVASPLQKMMLSFRDSRRTYRRRC